MRESNVPYAFARLRKPARLSRSDEWIEAASSLK